MKQIEASVESAFNDRAVILANSLGPVFSKTSTEPPSLTIPVMKGSVNKGLKAYNSGDYETALARWLPKAKAGDAAAQNNMGVLFRDGLTRQTPKSDEEAGGWFLLSAQQGFVVAMNNLADVQTRLGNIAAADSWRALAVTTTQGRLAVQQQQQQQNGALLGYALGCAIAGGCRATAPQAPTVPMSSYQRQPAPVGFSQPAPSPYQPPQPPKCKISTWQKDIMGNPAIECTAQ